MHLNINYYLFKRMRHRLSEEAGRVMTVPFLLDAFRNLDEAQISIMYVHQFK